MFNPYIFDRVGIILNPNLDSVPVTQRKIALNEISERNFPLAAIPNNQADEFRRAGLHVRKTDALFSAFERRP